MRISKAVTDYYGCWRCGKCCKLNGIQVTSKEIQTIITEAEKNGLKLSEIEKRIVLTPEILHPEVGEYMIKYPCFLLDDDNGCSIYDSRPYICRTFPFLSTKTKDGLVISINGYNSCPMATQIIDEYLDYAEKYPNIEFNWFNDFTGEKSNLNIDGYQFLYYCKEKGIIDKV